MKKLLYFGADYCSACKALWPIVEKEAPEKGYEVEYYDMDTEEGAEMGADMNVRSLPTIIIMEEGDITKKAVGNTAWKEVQE